MKIHYSGRTYSSLAELPPEGQALFGRLTSHLADRDNNGVPDLLEGANVDTEITLNSDRQITINRRSYEDLTQAPAGDQQLLRQMRQLFDQIGDGDVSSHPSRNSSLVQVEINGSPVTLDVFRSAASRYLGIDERHPLASHFTWPGILYSPLVRWIVVLLTLLVVLALLALLSRALNEAVGL
jgi:hypothetical protein